MKCFFDLSNFLEEIERITGRKARGLQMETPGLPACYPLNLFKKIREIKETFHAKMGKIKERNAMDLTEAEDIKKSWQEYIELYQEILMTQITTMV